MLAAAIALDLELFGRIGSAIGLVGAIAFAWFSGEITWRVAGARTSR
jgi:hypothetical protein